MGRDKWRGDLPRINVFVTNITAERLWDVDRAIPGQIHISINLNVIGFEKRSDKAVEAPFIFNVTFNPAIAQITVKGRSRIIGSSLELDEILRGGSEGKPPPAFIVQAISNGAMAEAIIASKAIGVPPPIPPITISGSEGKPPEGSSYRYTA
ncbi:MAG: hypothetical protein QW238_03535 [Candidatus Bathyarchaeia archaeon]